MLFVMRSIITSLLGIVWGVALCFLCQREVLHYSQRREKARSEVDDKSKQGSAKSKQAKKNAKERQRKKNKEDADCVGMLEREKIHLRLVRRTLRMLRKCWDKLGNSKA